MWLFSKYPDFNRDHGNKIVMFMKYVWPEALDYIHNVSFYAVRGENIYYVMISSDGKLSKGTASDGTRIVFDEEESALEIREVLEDAEVRAVVTNVGAGEGKVGIRVRVLEGNAAPKDSEWLIDGEEHYLPLGGDGFYATLSSYPGKIKDFKSKLQIVAGGKVVAEKTIEVNHPLTYGGYSFYQASYDQEQELWSGIQVVKDPGVPLVFTGFVLLVAGLVGIFYLQPMLKSSGKSREGALQ